MRGSAGSAKWLRPSRTLPQVLAMLALLLGVLGMHSLSDCDMGPVSHAAPSAQAISGHASPGHASSGHAGSGHAGSGHAGSGHAAAADPAVVDAAPEDCQYHQCAAIITAATPSFPAPHPGAWTTPPPVPSTLPASWVLPAQSLGTAPSWTNHSLAQLQILRV